MKGKDYHVGKKMLFITHYPKGELQEVTILGKWKGQEKYYFAKPNGGSDSTTTDFLLEYPKTINPPSESDNKALEILSRFGITEEEIS